MTALFNFGGSHRLPKSVHAKVGSVWTPAQKLHIRVGGAWQVHYQNEVVVTLATRNNVVLKTLFTPEQWNDPNLKKRVVIPEQVHIGAGAPDYALATTLQADGQAGSFAGQLLLEVRGTISGIGGAANSGTGGDAIWANFPGQAGQPMLISNYGTLRSGGGGGGRGGTGGQGSYANSEDTGYQYSQYYRHWEINFAALGARQTKVWWDSSNIYAANGETYSITYGGFYYVAGSQVGSSNTWRFYQVRRYRVTPVTVVTNGGAGGAGGRGYGFDGVNTGGSAGSAGGTNAGVGGTGGTGGTWGAPGATGNTGATGNYTGGAAGAAGGLAGCYLKGASNATLTNIGGTLQGRII
jgi:hypothetical protein